MGHPLFTVLRPARYVDEQERVDFGELHVFTGHNYVVTIRHAESPDLASVRRRLEGNRELLCLGPEAVLYAIFDRWSMSTARSWPGCIPARSLQAARELEAAADVFLHLAATSRYQWAASDALFYSVRTTGVQCILWLRRCLISLSAASSTMPSSASLARSRCQLLLARHLIPALGGRRDEADLRLPWGGLGVFQLGCT